MKDSNSRPEYEEDAGHEYWNPEGSTYTQMLDSFEGAQAQYT